MSKDENLEDVQERVSVQQEESDSATEVIKSLQEKQRNTIFNATIAMARRVLPGSVRALGNRAIAHAVMIRQRSKAARLAPPASSGLLTLFPGKYDVFFFPIIDFDFANVQRPQHFAKRFAREGHRVFYLRTDFAISRSWRPPTVRQVERNIFIVQLQSPRAINLYSDEIDRTSLDWFRAQLDWLEVNYAIVDSVCLAELPFWTPLVSELREAHEWKVIYDCLDYIRGFSNVSQKMFRQEEALVKSADLVLTTSKTLFDRISPAARKCLLLRNACDYEMFSKGGAVPPDLENLKRPIVGYYGSIAEWFDVELVAETAAAHPDKTFVLIGKVADADVSRLKRLRNVHLFGPRPYEILPSYLESFDVCFIPFRKTDLTAATDPVKVYEMLAAGKGIVAVQLPELSQIKDLVYLASGREDFVSKIDLALLEKDRERPASERKLYAVANTWEKRFETLLHEIESLYERASVIIVTHNNRELTRACLDGILQVTTYPSLEVIVVDNGSTDGTPEMLADIQRDHDNVRIFLSSENKGFANAVNVGLRECKGQYLFVLNNDVIATRGSFSKLIGYLRRDPAVGLICPLTNSAGNEILLSIPTPPNYQWISDLAVKILFSRRGTRFPIRTVPLYFAGTTRDVVDDVGLLDERFEIGLFEDDDWAYRMRLSGYTTLCAEDVFVFHAGGASFSSLRENRYLQVFEKNRERYESKWGTEWLRYAPKEDLTERREAIKKAVRELRLLLREDPGRPVVIFPPGESWSHPLFQRPKHLARKLAQMGYIVFFSVECGDFDHPTLGFEKVEERLYKANVPQETYIEVDKPIVWTTCYNRQYLQYYRRPIIVYDYLYDLSVFPHDQRVLRSQHDWSVMHADLVIATADILLEEVKKTRPDALSCPNAAEFSDFIRPDSKGLPRDMQNIRDEGKPVVGYVGAISRWLDYELLTRITDLKPDVNFVLIGYELDDSARKTDLFLRKNVRFLGPREYAEIPRYLSGMDIAIIPFRADRVGATTSPIKLFEYLAAGKPVVTSDMRECGKYAEVFVSRSYEEFATNIEKAMNKSKDPVFRERLRKIAESNTWEMRARTIVEALTSRGAEGLAA